MAHCRDSWVVQEQATEVRISNTCDTFRYILLKAVSRLRDVKWRCAHFECIQMALFLRSQAGPEDARANIAGGGSRETFWDPEWPQETMVLLHDLECTFDMQTTPIRTCIKIFFFYLLTWQHFYTNPPTKNFELCTLVTFKNALNQ